MHSWILPCSDVKRLFYAKTIHKCHFFMDLEGLEVEGVCLLLHLITIKNLFLANDDLRITI